jgi:hypothetical protein
MNYLKIACVLVVAATLGACGDDGMVSDAGSDTIMTVDSSPMDTAVPELCEGGSEYFFVASVLNVGQADPTGDPNIVPGFNLDGLVSDGTDAESCLHTDFTSPPPDNEPGVDNQLGPILDAVGSSLDIGGTIAENILEGSVLILMEVEHVDSTMNDGCVTLNLYLGQMPAGVAMPVDSDGDGIIDANQTFDIDPASLVAGEPLISVQGQIVNGRLSAGPVDIELNLPVSGATLNLNIRTAQVRLSFAGDNITAGVIGGGLNIVETVETIVAIDPDAIPESLATSVLEAQADLEIDDEGFCTAVSIGLVFEGVPAVKGDVGMVGTPDAGPADTGTGADAGADAG